MILGVAHGLGNQTWNGCPTFDLSETVVFEQLFIHDSHSSDPAGGGGSHGFYSDGVGMAASRLLVVRITDDGIGGHTSGFTSTPQPFVIEDARIFAILPDVPKTTQCFEPTGDNALVADENEQERARGKIYATDVVAIGCSQEAVNQVAYGGYLSRFVTSGTNYSGLAQGSPAFSAAPSTVTLGATPFQLDLPGYANRVLDAAVFLIGGQHSASPFGVVGHCEACVVVGNVGQVAGTRLWGTTDYARSFLHLANQPSRIVDQVGVAAWRTRTLEITDSVFLSETASRFGNAHTDLDAAVLSRVWVGLGPGPTETLGGVADVAGNVWIDGAVGTSADPAGASTLGTLAGATLIDPCLETTLGSDVLAFGGAAVFGQGVRSPTLGPDPSVDAPLRAYVRSASGTAPCDHAAPSALGLRASNLGRAHADLGDLFLDHWDRYSSDDLTVLPEPSGRAASGSAVVLVWALARTRHRKRWDAALRAT
ncbi:MAG: hypothetical protein AAF430_26340 [Myxococcota bacterium]